MLPATATRVEEHTADYVNERIRHQTDQSIVRTVADGPAAIDRRLMELDQEWDIERTLQTNFAAVVLAGIALGELVDRRWHVLPVIAGAFMIQHALQGWCPPLEVFRRFGVRAESEIEHERHALKAHRGDYRDIAGSGDAGRATSHLAAEAAR